MPVDWLIETRKETAWGMTETPRGTGHTNTTEETGNGWAGVGWRRSRQPTETVLRKEYRREDQYLCIEIQLDENVAGCKLPWKENSLISRGIGDFVIYLARAPLFFGSIRLNVSINPKFFLSGAPVLINRRVNLGLTRGNRERGAPKSPKIGELSFRGILQPTTVTTWWVGEWRRGGGANAVRYATECAP